MDKSHFSDLSTNVILFGAGQAGCSAAYELISKGLSILRVFDNDESKWGAKLLDLWPIQKPSKCEELIAIGSMYAVDIAQQLKQLGCQYFYYGPCFDRDQFFFRDIPKDEVNWLRSKLEDQNSIDVLNSLVSFRQTGDPLCLLVSPYCMYDHPVVKPRIDTVIVDGGAWKGDTAEYFKRATNQRCLVICFEPNSKSLACIPDQGVLKVSKGLFCRDGTIELAIEKNSNQCRIVENYPSDKAIPAEVVKLDTFKKSFDGLISLIKLDIEGAERDAIVGASDLLLSEQPDLMISLYHKHDDLWVLPKLINDINPDYKFFMGHHSQYLFDTVLYATVNSARGYL